MKTKPLISKELADFLESGLSFTVATRDDELLATGIRAWAARVHDDRGAVTLYLHKPAATATLRNLKFHGEMAVCIDRPSDNCACQLKGRFLAVRPARAGERREVERQAAGFLAELEAIGIPRAMTAGWAHWPCVAVDMQVTEIYEQTPGPGTGGPLAPRTMPAGTAPADAAP